MRDRTVLPPTRPEVLQGRRLQASEADIHQRGGNVLLDPRGRVRFHHIGSGPADRPALETIFRVVEQEKREKGTDLLFLVATTLNCTDK